MKSIPIQDLDIANMEYGVPYKVHCPDDPYEVMFNKSNKNKVNSSKMRELTIKVKIEEKADLGEFVNKAFDTGMVVGKFATGEEFEIVEKAPIKKRKPVKKDTPKTESKPSIKDTVENKVADVINAIPNTTPEAPVVVEAPVTAPASAPAVEAPVAPAVEAPAVDNPLMSIPTVG